MTTAVLDTNVLVQAAISSPRSASARTLRAYRDKRFQLVFSAETLDELYQVLTLPKIQARHGWSDAEISRHITFLLANSFFYHVSQAVPASLARDITDTKFLALSGEATTDYLVTNDRRHLLRLKRYGRTKIVTPAEFLRALS